MPITEAVTPLITGAALYAVDYTDVVSKRANLQDAADAAALSTVREMAFIYLDKGKGGQINHTLSSIALGIAQNNLKGSGERLTVVAERLSSEQVRVDLSLDIDTAFSALTGLRDQTITAYAIAEVFGGQNICVLLLQGYRLHPGTQLEDSAQIKADNCGLHSNAPGANSITVKASAHMGMDYICAVGGYDGGSTNVKTPVTTDCPVIENPLIQRQITGISAGECPNNQPSEGIMIPGSTPSKYPITTEVRGIGRNIDHTIEVDMQTVASGAHTISPGTYCGGLIIEGDADVWMKPGKYYFNGGPLIVRGDAKLSGEYVGVFHNDVFSYFAFMENSEIELSAPKTGEMAGILFTTGPKCTNAGCLYSRPFTIESSGVRSLLGTLYLPDDPLVIDTTMSVSEEAAFTIIISDRLYLRQSPTLVLNTDYAATDVPRPGELQDVEPKIRLLE